MKRNWSYWELVKVALAQLCLPQRWATTYLVSDSTPVKDTYRKEHLSMAFFRRGNAHDGKGPGADEIMKSPGIPEKADVMKQIRAKGIPVISEIEFVYRYIGNSRVVAITGSNGKTTTTALTYHICRHANEDCALVGNIGYSFARQVALDPKTTVHRRISSFQLDDIQRSRPHVAVLTNITEDHLDRYDYKMENYVNSKFRIAENQRNR